MLDFSVDPPDTVASECAAGWPAVEKGDWRGNYHSPKPCLHNIKKIRIMAANANCNKQKFL
jgi:hypothetical protein